MKFKNTYTTVIILFSFLPLISNSGMLWAAPATSAGCMVEVSPFYNKLLKAGVLDVPVSKPSRAPEPVKILFIKAHMFHYTPDRSQKETWQSAEETTRLFRGDCADKAIWLYTHMRQNGYENVSLLIGRYSPSSQMLHMWVTYDEPSGNVLLLDPTIQRKPWKVTDFSKKYYKRLYMLSGQECATF